MASPEPLIIAENGITAASNGGGAGDDAADAPLRGKTSFDQESSGNGVALLRSVTASVRVVLLETKLSALFLAIPLAIVAQYRRFGSPWVFGLSLIGLTPLAERLSFLTEKIASYTGPTVGGLVNATFGNVPELIVVILALIHHKVEVVKYSLLGSILSNLLLVLGSSLFCGGIANLSKEQKFDKKQAHVNSSLLLLALMCHVLPLMSMLAGNSPVGMLALSRTSCIVMFVAYFAYLVFQLWTHRQFHESQGDDEQEGIDHLLPMLDESPVVIGFWSAFLWLVLVIAFVALLSEYIVATIEAASDSWGLSVSFISVILLPIFGNAAEHAGAIIFALKNNLDLALGVALGSATQIAMFLMPLSVMVSWIIGIRMGLDLSLLETSALGLSIILTAFTLQDGTSHYMKGLVLLLSYMVIGACFFVFSVTPSWLGTIGKNILGKLWTKLK